MRFLISLILGCVPLSCLGAPPKDIPSKVIPTSVPPESIDSSAQKSGVSSTIFTSEWGFIRHVDTGMIVYSENDNCSVPYSRLKVGYNKGKGPLEVRYGSIGRANYGYFTTKCGTGIGPESASKDMEPVVLRPNGMQHYIDEQYPQIVFVDDGRFKLDLYGGSENPQDGAQLIITAAYSGARLQFVPMIGPTYAYSPTPELSGEWVKIAEVIVSEPGATYPHPVLYTVGSNKKYTEDRFGSWQPAPARAFEWYRDSKFNYYACRSESVTWHPGIGRKEVFEVSYGVNIFYQWKFFAILYNIEVFQYQSSIITVARARNAVPEMMHAAENEFC